APLTPTPRPRFGGEGRRRNAPPHSVTAPLGTPRNSADCVPSHLPLQWPVVDVHLPGEFPRTMRASLLSAARRPPWRRMLVLGGGLFVVGPATASLTQSLTAKGQLEAAERAGRRYDFVAARQHLQQVLRRWPTNARAQFLDARMTRRLDDYAEA